MTKRIAILCALAAAGCAATSDDSTSAAESAVTAVAPVSTISASVDDGTPTSQFPVPPSVTMTCDIPKVVLDQYPIFQGDPKMTSCTLTTRVVGNPPTGTSITLECRNTKNGTTYDSFTCGMTIGVSPLVFSTIGTVVYGDPAQGTVAIPDATCAAYLQRAAGICGATGVQVD